jgi:hypothetical protein
VQSQIVPGFGVFSQIAAGNLDVRNLSGLDDIAALSVATSTIMVYVSTGGGVFASPNILPPVAGIEGIYLVDISGNYKVSILAPGPTTLTMYHGYGNGKDFNVATSAIQGG